MKRNLLFAITALAICLLPAVGRAQAPSTADLTKTSSSQPIAIGAGDLLNIAVFDTPELTGPVRVTEGGDAALPLIGMVHLGGLSPIEAQQLIRQRLMDGDFVKDPQVTVLIAEYATQGVTVMGEVMKPGIYPVIGHKQLHDVVSLASGLTPAAGQVATITHRRNPDQPVVVRLKDASGSLSSQNVFLEPGDTITVLRAGIVFVLGDVVKPGGFVMDKESVTVVEALALAQGPARTASLNGAKLLRKTADGLQQTPLRLKSILSGKSEDVVVQAGDVVYVPSSALKSTFSSMQSVFASAAGAAVFASM